IPAALISEGVVVNGFPRFGLDGRVALVTGAARGLGRAIALALADAGADVALGLRDASTGEDLAAEIQGMGRVGLAVQMDVTSLEQITAAVEQVVARFGRLELLGNNAGLGPEGTAGGGCVGGWCGPPGWPPW